jgi:ketosteroid isomerase-like protein
MIELGDRVVVQLRGKRLERLGAKGFVPRLFQIVVFRDGKVASMQDYARREDAFAAAGLKP